MRRHNGREDPVDAVRGVGSVGHERDQEPIQVGAEGLPAPFSRAGVGASSSFALSRVRNRGKNQSISRSPLPSVGLSWKLDA